MKQTYQSKNLNMFEHGELVWFYYQKLLNNNTEDMKIPKWFIENKEWFLRNICDLEIIKTYIIYHDIGKIECLTVDEFGKQHFPNHSFLSEKIWLDIGGDPLVAKLMGLDMIFHTENADKIVHMFLEDKILNTLILAALAELHANAQMFGGINSESFCIKLKKLGGRVKKVINYFK